MSQSAHLHELTQLCRLVESLSGWAMRASTDSAYTDCARDFLSFVRSAACSTKRKLRAWGRKKRLGPEPTTRELLVTLTDAWRIIHDFLKPVLDAHALTTPYPLVRLINTQVAHMERLKDSRIVIGLVPQLNYFQRKHGPLRDLLQKLQRVVRVPEKRRYDDRIGFLGLPYSRSQGILCNVLLYHELGHFVFEDHRLALDIFAKLEPQIEKRFKPEVPSGAWRPRDTYFVAFKYIMPWMEELFADIVAVKLIGPAFLICAAEMMGVSGMKAKSALAFGRTHPANGLRFREQMKALEQDGWSESRLSALASPSWQCIKKLIADDPDCYKPPSDYTASEEDRVWPRVRDILFDHIPFVHRMAEDSLAGRSNPCKAYEVAGQNVKEYLSHGLVPSVAPNGKGPEFVMMDPVGVVNAAVFFWQEGMRELYAHLEKGKRRARDVGARATVEERLELWVGKAIQDWLLLRGRPMNQLRVPQA